MTPQPVSDSRGAALGRLAPAWLLFFLAPVVAEYLLGDLTIRMLAPLVALGPLYGGGALLIREIARRTGRGWPTIVLLAIAYAVTEESFLTQSLFNPDYVHQRLLDYGYMPMLGTSLNWTVFVLSIHVVWSVATPILIAEGFAGRLGRTPWLRTPGLMLTTALFLFGSGLVMTVSLKDTPFRASAAQLLTAGVVVVVVLVAAFAVKPREHEVPATGAPPSWWVVAVTSFALAGAFALIQQLTRGNNVLPAVGVGGMLACELIAAVAILGWSKRRGWGEVYYLALAAGTVAVYFLTGLQAFLHGQTNLKVPATSVDVIGQVVIAAIIYLLIAVGMRRQPAPLAA